MTKKDSDDKLKNRPWWDQNEMELSNSTCWDYYLGYYQKSFINREKDDNIGILLLKVDFNREYAEIEYFSDEKANPNCPQAITYLNGKIIQDNNTTVITLERFKNPKRLTTLLLSTPISKSDTTNTSFTGAWSRYYGGTIMASLLICFRKIVLESSTDWRKIDYKNIANLTILNRIIGQRVFGSQSDNNWALLSNQDDFDRNLINSLEGEYYYYYLVENNNGKYIRKTPLQINRKVFFEAIRFNPHTEIETTSQDLGIIKIYDNKLRIEFGQFDKISKGQDYTLFDLTFVKKISSTKKENIYTFEGIITEIKKESNRWCSKVLVQKEKSNFETRSINYDLQSSELNGYIEQENKHIKVENLDKTFKQELKRFFLSENNTNTPSKEILQLIEEKM